MGRLKTVLVFGGRGAIGASVRERFAGKGWAVTATSRFGGPDAGDDWTKWVACDPDKTFFSVEDLAARGPFSAVCWAQGANLADSVLDIDAVQHMDLYRANCLFVLTTLRMLLENELLATGARLVIVSSIWQKIARPEKLSYSMTKAAIGGLVRSASVDLAHRGILINAVLPSALDTPMTIANLSSAQIRRFAGATGFDRLTSLEDVVGAIDFLCSEQNTGITGQSLVVDLGFSHANLV